MHPKYLTKNDRIGIVACAGKVDENQILSSISIFNTWGLDVKIGKNIFRKQNQFAGTDEERADDLQTMLNDNSIKAVISARGGYGTIRIIDSIDLKKFIQHPKWIVGYSDITVLHSHIHNFGIETIHGTMPINFTKSDEANETLRKALFGERLEYSIENHVLNRQGNAEAVLVGGNLSLLFSLIGSKSDIDTRGKILFIEDLDEYLYHIDRIMISLKRVGKLDGLAGLVVGGFTEMKDNSTPFGKTVEEIITDAVKEFDFPVCFGFPAGHIDRNLALRFGKLTSLIVGEKIYLKQ